MVVTCEVWISPSRARRGMAPSGLGEQTGKLECYGIGIIGKGRSTLVIYISSHHGRVQSGRRWLVALLVFLFVAGA